MSQLADLIVTNGRVLTMDGTFPRAEALAMAGGRIIAVGTTAEVLAFRHAGTRLIDAGGKSVLPGFNEAHIHLFSGGAELDQLSLAGIRGFDTLKRLVLDYAASRPHDPLLMANSADYVILDDGRDLDRHVLDAILPNRPLALMSPDHHTVWANTIALEKAGLLHGRALPPGHEVVMGADGLATGELCEPYAFDEVLLLGAGGGRDRLGVLTGEDPDPAPSAAERAYDRNLLRQGLKHLARHGITSFQNMDGNRYQLELLAALEAEGDLICRARFPQFYASGDIADWMDRAAALHADFSSEFLRAGAVKMFMDGVLDSHTAFMSEDYEDRPGWQGEARFTPEDFNCACIEADRRGLQIAVHAIGDGAVARVIDGYAAARAANGARDSRHRIEHVEVIRQGDIARMKALDIVASMQPTHPPGQMGLPFEPTISRIGKTNWPRAYAWRALREAGVPLIFSSDWPVSPVSPLRSMHSAMTRKPWAEGLPDNRQTLGEALAAYTSGPAWVEFAEGWKGRLKPGFVADVVVLDADLEAIEPEAVEHVRPVTTICGGRVTYEA